MTKKIFFYGRRFLKHELITGSFFIFVGSLIGNFLAFLFNIFLARNLTPSDYGSYATLVSAIILIGIPAQSLTTVIIRFATDYLSSDQMDKAMNLYKITFKFNALVAFLLAVVSFLLSKPISQFLKLENENYVFFAGIVVSVSYLSISNFSFLQSLFKFKYLAAINIIGGLIKLSCGVLLIFLGFRVFGGIAAIFSMYFVMFFLGFFPLKTFFLGNNPHKNISLKEVFSYALPAGITVFALTSITSADVILVKHFFKQELAGIYAGMSLIGKVIFYFTGPITTVMFPLLVKRHTKKENFNNLFYLTLILVGACSIGITLFYFIFPSLIIKIFLGTSAYLSASSYLGLFGIFITVFSILSVVVNFFLSVKKLLVSFFVSIAAVMQIVLIVMFHENFIQIITVSISISSLLLIALLLYYLKEYTRLKKYADFFGFFTIPRL